MSVIDNCVVPISSIDTISPDKLRAWFRRGKRKFRCGVSILKVTSQGKLVRRTVFVDAKPEYFEITSAKLFDLGYHMSDIESVVIGCNSPQFELLALQHPERIPNPSKCCVLRVDSKTLSLIFKSLSDVRDFAYLILIQVAVLKQKYFNYSLDKEQQFSKILAQNKS